MPWSTLRCIWNHFRARGSLADLSTVAVEALDTHRRPPDFAAPCAVAISLGMNEAVAAHWRDEDRRRELLAEYGDGCVDLVPNDGAHPVWGEGVVTECAPVLAQRPLLARAMGNEHVDAIGELGLGLRFQEIDVDASRYLSST